jgi:glycosyltransferase involved in cell wall biosynthesis
VCWWTSDFSHRFKKRLDRDAIRARCRTIGIEIEFMPGLAYYRNVSFRRLVNNYLLARYFNKKVGDKSEPPAVIVASSPPPMLTNQAARFAKRCGVKMIVDFQDFWPGGFYLAVPKWLHPLCWIIFLPWSRSFNKAFRLADAYVGLADTYIDYATKTGGVKKLNAVIPLGLDCQLFDSEVPQGISGEFTKPADEIWFTYAGSLSRSHDFLTLAKAYSKVHRTLGVKSRLFIAGRGELSGELDRLIEEEQLTNVVVTGFLDLKTLAYLLSQCDVGFNPSWPMTRIVLPYRLFYYFAAGLAVLNTMPGECSRIIRQNNCGIDYRAGDIDSCMQAIRDIVSDVERLGSMQQNSRRLAEEVYDRGVLYQQYVEFIEEVANN